MTFVQTYRSEMAELEPPEHLRYKTRFSLQQRFPLFDRSLETQGVFFLRGLPSKEESATPMPEGIAPQVLRQNCFLQLLHFMSRSGTGSTEPSTPLVCGLHVVPHMARRKKTRSGAEIRSLVGAKRFQEPIWWLAVLHKNQVQIFSFSPIEHQLCPLWKREEKDFHDLIARRLRGSAGRTQESFSWSAGGHQTGHRRHSYSSATPPKKRASQTLLAAGAHFVKQEYRKRKFDHLALVANPAVYGTFKELLGARLAKKVTLHAPALPNYLSSRQQEKQLLSLMATQ
ncbi:hypothetical protein EBR78_04675 [bacterium]|nr:hypothetical protein [bacterium]